MDMEVQTRSRIEEEQTEPAIRPGYRSRPASDFGADDAVEAGGFHLAATEAEGGEVRVADVQLGDDLRAVVVSAGFAGREEDARVGVGGDGTSVDFSGRGCMAGTAAKRFRAALEPLGDELRWVVARVPFDVKTAWKTMVRLRVTVEIGGEVFRASLFAYALLIWRSVRRWCLWRWRRYLKARRGWRSGMRGWAWRCGGMSANGLRE
jgi:hypothetical protein